MFNFRRSPSVSWSCFRSTTLPALSSFGDCMPSFSSASLFVLRHNETNKSQHRPGNNRPELPVSASLSETNFTGIVNRDKTGGREHHLPILSHRRRRPKDKGNKIRQDQTTHTKRQEKVRARQDKRKARPDETRQDRTDQDRTEQGALRMRQNKRR
jgi:hypothetical protein